MSTRTDDIERRAITEFLSQRTEEAFCALFDAFYIRLCRYFCAHDVEPAVAEELSENVMFQVYRHISQLRDGRSFYGWIFQIARNEWLRHRRRLASELPTVAYEPIAGHLGDTLDSGERLDADGPFREWMQQLDETEGEILTLRFVEDLDYPEIAEILKIPVGTIKWKVFNAKSKLAELTGRKAVKTR